MEYAVRNNYISIVEYLVNHNANIIAKSKIVEFLYINELLFIALPIMAI